MYKKIIFLLFFLVGIKNYYHGPPYLAGTVNKGEPDIMVKKIYYEKN